MEAERSAERTYRGRSPAQWDADRRRRLLDAALDLIGGQGYAAMSVERLCAAAKVSTRHFYQRYASKEEVLLDLYATLSQPAFAAVTASLERTARARMSVPDRLADAVRAFLAPMLADPRVARVVFVEVLGVGPRVEASFLAHRRLVVDVIVAEAEAAVERGELAPRDFRFAALCFSGAAMVVVHDWTLGDERDDDAAQALMARLVAVALHLLTSPTVL